MRCLAELPRAAQLSGLRASLTAAKAALLFGEAGILARPLHMRPNGDVDARLAAAARVIVADDAAMADADADRCVPSLPPV